jgi:Ferritin-like
MAIRWKWTSAPARRPTLTAATAATAATTLEQAIDVTLSVLPDLSGYPSPVDKAHVLLEGAAEVEHMLLVQYLYAAMTLKTGDQLMALTPDQQKAIRYWGTSLRTVAIEEMGHLMSVQNLRLFVGADPIFDREEFPRKDLYPFEMHLEPLSRLSLAKYVLAESPFSADGDLGAYREIVGPQTSVRHVGVIYGLLAILFSAVDTLPPSSDTDEWSTFVRLIADRVGGADDPSHWHVAEASFHPESLPKQAVPDHFFGPAGFFFTQVDTPQKARDLVRAIGVQGEASVELGGAASHYKRFRTIFEGSATTAIPFPSDGSFQPAADVDIDPRLESFEGEALSVATELDAEYAATIGSLVAYFVVAPAEREEMAQTAVQNMRDMSAKARDLVRLPQKPGSTRAASPVFTPPGF